MFVGDKILDTIKFKKNNQGTHNEYIDDAQMTVILLFILTRKNIRWLKYYRNKLQNLFGSEPTSQWYH